VLKFAYLIITASFFFLINTHQLSADDITIDDSTDVSILDEPPRKNITITSSGSITTPDSNAVRGQNNIGFATISNAGTISAGDNAIFTISDIDSIVNTGIISSTSSAVIDIDDFNTPTTTGSVGLITNLGTITGRGYHIKNSGTITTLNNRQGAGNSSGALTYTGALPTNYNIIINSTSIYGKLAVTSGTGSMAFGVYSTSTLTSNLYTGVLSGVASSRISNLSGSTVTGTLGLFNWTLQDLDANNTWDLLVALNGPAIADTMNSLTDQSNKLRQVFNNQTNIANNSLNYDCSLFSNNNMCVAIGGRYSKYDYEGQRNAADILVLGYKVNPNFRVSAHMDQK
jgi:hypothetical protein